MSVPGNQGGRHACARCGNPNIVDWNRTALPAKLFHNVPEQLAHQPVHRQSLDPVRAVEQLCDPPFAALVPASRAKPLLRTRVTARLTPSRSITVWFKDFAVPPLLLFQRSGDFLGQIANR